MNAQEYGKEIRRIIQQPDIQPHGSITFCNVFVMRVAWLFGFLGFDGKTANNIYHILKATPYNFQPMGPKPNYKAIAARASMDPAAFILAAQPGPAHGHVCIVPPFGGTTFSWKWAKTVCNVSNVGKDVFENKGLNWAFAKEPEIFLYTGGAA